MPKHLPKHVALSTRALRGLSHLLRWLGLVVGVKAFARFGRVLGWLISFARPREMNIAAAQIQTVARVHPAARTIDYFQQSSRSSARACFAHVGQSFAEAIMIPQIIKRREQYITAEGDDIVDRFLGEKSGAVCLSGHIGCFELLAAYHVSRGVPLSVIGRYPNFPSLAEFLTAMRKTYGVEVIWRGDTSSGRKLYKSLSQGAFLAALIDQDTKLKNNYTSFLGIQAAYPILLVHYALRLHRPILSSFIVRDSPNHHRIITRQIYPDSSKEDIAQDILEQFNTQFEALLLEYPEQWIWWHRRWRRQREHELHEKNMEKKRLLTTDEYIKWLQRL